MTRPFPLLPAGERPRRKRAAPEEARRKPRRWREQELVHRPFVRFLEVALPRGRVREHGCWWHHSPNEAMRAENVGILVGLGTLIGFSDVLLVKRGFAHVVECKAPGEWLDADQLAFFELCRLTGVPCEAIEAPEEGEAFLRRWGFPLMATYRPGEFA